MGPQNLECSGTIDELARERVRDQAKPWSLMETLLTWPGFDGQGMYMLQVGVITTVWNASLSPTKSGRASFCMPQCAGAQHGAKLFPNFDSTIPSTLCSFTRAHLHTCSDPCSVTCANNLQDVVGPLKWAVES